MEGSDNKRKGSKNNTANIQPWNNTAWFGGNGTIPVKSSSDTAHSRQIGVSYLLYKEVFASDSKTRHFNRAVDRIRADPRALELLGSGQTIRAFGEPTANKWARARPIA